MKRPKIIQKPDRFAFFHCNEPLLYQFLLQSTLQVLEARPNSSEHTPCAAFHPKSPVDKLGSHLALMALHFKPFEPIEHTYQELISSPPTESSKIATRLIEQLLEKLPNYTDEPSVIYFLLRNRCSFDQHLKLSIKELLEKLLGERAEALIPFLQKCFSERNFDHLAPQIEGLLADG